MTVLHIQNAIFERVKERTYVLAEAYRVADHAEAAHIAAAQAFEKCPTEEGNRILVSCECALDIAQGTVINAAHTLTFSISTLLAATHGVFTDLNHRVAAVKEALKAETQAL